MPFWEIGDSDYLFCQQDQQQFATPTVPPFLGGDEGRPQSSGGVSLSVGGTHRPLPVGIVRQMEVGGGKLSSFFTPMSVQQVQLVQLNTRTTVAAAGYETENVQQQQLAAQHQQLQQQQQKESTTKEKQLELNPILRQEVSYCV